MNLYLASAQAGNCASLEKVVKELSQKHIVFAPYLAFYGSETIISRRRIMNVCFWIIANWADVFVTLGEGVESKGMTQETSWAGIRGIPTFRLSKMQPLANLSERLDELQKNPRNSKS